MKLEDLNINEIVIVTDENDTEQAAQVKGLSAKYEAVDVSIISSGINKTFSVNDVSKIQKKEQGWTKWDGDNIIPVNEKIDDPQNGYLIDKLYLVKVGTETHYNYDIARYTEWGWHYASRDTQNAIFNVMEYKPISV